MSLKDEELLEAKTEIERVAGLLQQAKEKQHNPLQVMEEFFVCWSRYALNEYKKDFRYTKNQYMWLLEIGRKLEESALGTEDSRTQATGAT